ncbi:MAG: carbohydrate ABC transporter permease [Geminicoccaceae bacterium]|nr:carbohydrate ABC transporter permease [Geminicoccaceae bacterium]
MHRYPRWPIHLILVIVSFVMLVPFYWVIKTSITGENIFNYPPSLWPVDPQPFFYVDAWYAIPFPRFFLNSVIVAGMAIVANLIINAAAGFALTKSFPGKRWMILLLLACMMIPFHATIIPAYLITAQLGLLNTHLGLALPAFSHIICIFLFKASFDAIPPSLIQAAKIDGVPEWQILLKIMLPLAKPAVATNIILSFIWSWNDFLWPLIIVRDVDMQTLPLGLSTFLAYFEDTTGALYAFCVMVLAPGLLVFLLAQRQFIAGLTSGARKG